MDSGYHQHTFANTQREQKKRVGPRHFSKVILHLAGIDPLFDQIHRADALLNPYRTGANKTEKLNKDSVTGEKQQMVNKKIG